MVETKTDFGCAAYVLGIASIVLGIFLSISVVGFVFGIIGLVLANRQKNSLSARAKKLSLIGIIVSVIMYVLNLILLSKLVESGAFPA